ncbi:hypothetical protein BSK57_03890 [Paenibacillus odorifer]|nr:hypothetical protein BSK57_03890 [Paenibacillus odorifer]
MKGAIEMSNRHNSRPYTINIIYGESNLNHIIDDLAKQTIHKNAGDFGINNMRIKKIQYNRRAM